MNIKKYFMLLFTSFILILPQVNSTHLMAEESQKQYTVIDSVFLYKKLPFREDKYQQIVNFEEEVNDTLTGDETVIEMGKDENGYYESDLCKKTTPFGYKVNYDWSLVKDWMCVYVDVKPDKSKHTNQSEINSNLLKQSKKQILFYTQDFPPFSHKVGENKVMGPGAGIIEKICQEIKVKCEIKPHEDWRKAQDEVKEGKAEGLFFLSKDNKRKEWLTFSSPIVHTEYGFFVREDDTWEFNTIHDFNDKTIAAYGPSGTYNALLTLSDALKKEGIKITLTQQPEIIYKNTEEALRALESGDIDIVYSNKTVGKHFKEREKLKLKYAGKHKSLDYYVGIRRSKELVAFSNQFYNKLDELIKDDEIRKILVNYDDEMILSDQRKIGWIYKLFLLEKKASETIE